MRKRYFTLAQANALISRIRPRIERLMQLSVQLRVSEAKAAGPGTSLTESQPVADATLLLDPAIHAPDLPAADEDAEKQGELTACLYETISDELRGIERLGAEVKELGIGLTVFPSFLEGSVEVLLAWTVTDAEIRAFYTPQGGYRTRKSVEGCRFTDGRSPAGQLRE